jgi:O-antigen/teichoic acid export membrane protein
VALDATKNTHISLWVAHSTLANMVGKLVALGIGFFLTPFIVHTLGPTQFGLWALVGSLAGHGALLDLGVSGALVKYVAEYRARGELRYAHGLVATALLVYAVIGVIVIALSSVVAWAFPILFNVPPNERATATLLVLLSGIGVGISIPCRAAGAVIRGLHRFDISNLLGVAGTTVSAAASIVVLLIGGGVLGLVAVNIVVMLILQVISIWFINRDAPELQFGLHGARRTLMRTITGYSSAIFVINLAGNLRAKTDEVVIGTALPISFITPYVLARRLSEIAQVIAEQFMKVLFPLASALDAEDDRIRLRMVYSAGTRITLALFIPLGTVVALLAGPLLAAWVGPEYSAYSPLVVILILVSLIDSTRWPASSVLQGMARHRWLAIVSIVSGVVNLLLSLLLVRYLGLTGVALGSLIPITAECFGFILPYAMYVLGLRVDEVLKQIVLPVLAPAVPMTAALLMVQESLAPDSLLSIAVVAFTGGLVYGIGYLLIGASALEREVYRRLALGLVRR